ncbi:hypothetical protein [Brevundimonas sp. Marseille-Q4549]
MAGPTQGEVYDGYRFLGGDPKDQNNWEQAAPVAAPEYGNGAQKLPNGDIVRYGPRGGLTVLQQGGGDGVGKLTEGQGKSIQYGLMMRGAEQDYQRARQEGYDPASLRNQAAAVAGLIPFDGDYFGRLIRDDVSDRGRQAELRWAEGNLRQLTGAAATNPEISRVAAINFDRGNDQLADQRYRTRSETYKGTRFAAGPGASALGDYPDARGRLAVDEKTGLPDYAGIASTVQGVDGGFDIGPDGRPVAPAPQAPTPGSSPETAIDIESGISPDEILALLENGGWVRRGDGQPFEATASRGAPEQGAQSLRPGLNLNPAATPDDVVAERRGGNDLMRRVDAGVRGAADTLTFGLADEIAAGANTVLPLDPGARSGFQDGFGQAFRNNLDIQRAVDRADAKDVPVSRGAGQVAGALVPAGAVVRGAGMGGRALATAPNALRAAAAGGAYGGAYGFGSAEGNALQRVPEAAVGGGVGLVTGAVGAPVAGFIGRRVGAPVGNALQAGNRFIGRQVGRAGEALNVPGAAALTERAQPNALRSGLNRFADRMGPQRVNALSGRVDEQTGLGIDVTAVDALDDASLGRVRALATRDTPARDLAVRFAEGRRERLPSRVRRIASEEVSSDARPTQAVMDELSSTRRANAGAINDFGGDMVALDDNAIQALRSDLAQGAVQAAIRRAQGSIDPAERDAANRLASLADTVRDNPAGARLTVREVQDISAALRNAADGAFRSNAPADGPVLANLGKAVRDAGRNISEGYRKWLGQYADDSDLLEAATTGRNFVSVSADPVSARSTDAFVGRAAAATPGELTVQRQAAGQAMQAAGSNPTTARGVLTNLAYDDDQYRRAASLGLDAERLKARAGAELRSVTQAQRASPRVGSETSTNAQDAGGAAGLSIGDLANPIRAAAGVALNRIRSRGFNDQEAQAIVEAVIDPARTQEVIGFLAQRMSKRDARNLQRVLRKQVTTGLLSGQQPSA